MTTNPNVNAIPTWVTCPLDTSLMTIAPVPANTRQKVPTASATNRFIVFNNNSVEAVFHPLPIVTFLRDSCRDRQSIFGGMPLSEPPTCNESIARLGGPPPNRPAANSLNAWTPSAAVSAAYSQYRRRKAPHLKANLESATVSDRITPEIFDQQEWLQLSSYIWLGEYTRRGMNWQARSGPSTVTRRFRQHNGLMKLAVTVGGQ